MAGPSNEKASVAVPPSDPEVTAKDWVARMLAETAHDSCVLEIHTVDSQAVPAARALIVGSKMPRLAAVTVTMNPPSIGKFEPLMSHTDRPSGESYEMSSVMVPTRTPDVTESGSVARIPRAILHSRLVSLFHSVSSAAVPPSLDLKQYWKRP
jgi:hypothetical protein